jgi:undecaprenyl-phosphate 4-deoxy-4-formamido-L-arabinose transferase
MANGSTEAVAGAAGRAVEGAVDVSIVIPIFNEAANIPILHERLARVLDDLGRSAEVWYVDDGSSDASLDLLRGIAQRDPRVAVIELSRNAGQHAAVLAGFDACRGAAVVTLDGDLQNPPEEIPRLLAELDRGVEVVGTWRESRNDPFLRRLASALVNRATSVTVGVQMRDYGCMLRAYRREVVEQIVACSERSAFIPALANTLARDTAEIEVAHAERAAGRSKYKLFKLM